MRTPGTKVYLWDTTDTERRKCGEQKGLETPVVHTVNDVD
jgi:hypothetical protein